MYTGKTYFLPGEAYKILIQSEAEDAWSLQIPENFNGNITHFDRRPKLTIEIVLWYVEKKGCTKSNITT